MPNVNVRWLIPCFSWLSEELNSKFSMDTTVALFTMVHDINSNFTNLEPIQLGKTHPSCMVLLVFCLFVF